MERIVSQQRGEFALYSLGKCGDLEEQQELQFGAVTFNIEAFSNTYRHELEIFATEVYYWQLCEKHDTIIQNCK